MQSAMQKILKNNAFQRFFHTNSTESNEKGHDKVRMA